MGLLNFLFGRKAEEDEIENEQAEAPRYGQLAEDAKLAEELRARNVAEERERETARAPRPRLWGYGRTSHRLAERVREEQLPRWSKVTRKLEKLERRLAEAESAKDVRDIAKRALAPRGTFRKIERGMEKRLTQLEEKGASRGEIRRYERDLRKLERRLRSPTRFLR